jgi:hypothetical protein
VHTHNAHGVQDRCAKQECHSRPGFYDHPTVWLSRTTDRPALVFNQPYDAVDPDELRAVISKYPALTAEAGPESWYGGSTVGIHVWNNGNRSKVA